MSTTALGADRDPRRCGNVIGSRTTTKLHSIQVLFRLYYAKGSVIVMILQGVDTHYTLLQGHTILEDLTPLWFSLPSSIDVPMCLSFMPLY